MKKRNKYALILAGIGSTLFITANVFAAIPKSNNVMPDYTLDTTVVTATRTAKTDLNTPNSTEILTQKDLEKTGADNLQTALAKVQGITYKSFGPAGSAMGAMTNGVIIRGVSNGTLVLLNGVPLNQQGKYYLDSIPISTVRRVEIIKGGSSVLYGSDAMAGVINVITKKDYNNKIAVGIGNYGQANKSIQVGLNKLSVAYSKQKWGRVDDAIDSYADINNSTSPLKISGIQEIKKRTDALYSKKESLNLTYNFDEHWNLLYNQYKNNNAYQVYFNNTQQPVIKDKNNNLLPAPKSNALQSDKRYENKQQYVQLIYTKDKAKGNIYYNETKLKSKNTDYWSAKDMKKEKGIATSTEQKYKTIGFDLHKKYDLSKTKNLVAGIAYEHQGLVNRKENIDNSRNVYSLYGQWDQKLNDKNEWIFGMRGTWTHAGKANLNYRNLSSSTSFIHKLNKEESVYANIAQSFIMPTLNQMYGSGFRVLSNPDLKPQKGINYEIGWKKKVNSHNWKVALFKIDIKDNITAIYSRKDKLYKYYNEEFRNIGLEISDNINAGEKWSYNWGVSYNNPKAKSNRADKNYWDRKFGRWQLNGGVNYKTNKLVASLQGTYLTGRVTTPSTKHSYGIKPYFLTSLTGIYKPDDRSTFNLAINNLLNRRDNVGHSGSSLNVTGRNFMISYDYNF